MTSDPGMGHRVSERPPESVTRTLDRLLPSVCVCHYPLSRGENRWTRHETRGSGHPYVEESNEDNTGSKILDVGEISSRRV